LLSEAVSTSGKIWLDLTLEDSADSTSAIKSWPVRGDIKSEPVDDTVTTLVFHAVETSQAAASGTTPPDESSPQLGQGGEDFVEHLKAMLATQGFTFTEGLEVPDPPPAPKTRIGIGYTFSPDPVAGKSPQNFEVWVRTDLLPAGAPARHWKIRALAADPTVQSVLRAQRGATAPAVESPEIPASFSLVILPKEGPWLRPAVDGNPAAREFLPIFAVAVTTTEEAVRQHVLEKPLTETNRDQLWAALQKAFAVWPLTREVSFSGEVNLAQGTYLDSKTPAWVTRLTDFNPVRREVVLIDEIKLGSQMRQLWAAFLARQTEEGKPMDRLLADKAKLEKELTDLLQKEYAWDPPHFATDADHQPRIAALLKQPGVASAEATVSGEDVAYTVLWFPRVSTLEASGNYSSDRGGNVSAKLSIQTRDYQFGGEGYLADRRRGLFADVTTTPQATKFPDHSMSSWGLLGEYTHESQVRLGTPQSFSLTDEETRAGVRWRLEGGKSTPAPKIPGAPVDDSTPPARVRAWKLEAIAGYRQSRLAGDNFTFVERPDGAAPFASVEFTGDWVRNDSLPNQLPLAQLHTEVSVDGSTGNGATTSFARSQLKIVADKKIGESRWENSLVRLTVSGGSVTAETPVAWWYRLGGDERMRGFEVGELAGRSFLHAGFEAGISSGAFFKKPETKPGEKPAPSAGFDFRNILILLGAEHVWIGDPPTFSPPSTTLRDAWSYSLTGEYAGAIPGLPGGARLALGYGYAPRSFHRFGRVFVSLHVPLSIPQPP
jgi:hypothetical protein